jgi:polysaccharide export outer membrane protein
MLALWIAASSLLLIRLFLSYASMVRRSARASTAPPELSSRVETWSTSRRIRVALSDEIGIPMAAGPFHPVILIPSKLLAEIGDGDLEQIGLHEAAHLTRRDDWMLFLQRIIEAVFALHPVVRWITMQIDLEREIACDDVVARSTGDARSYADCLTRMVVLCGGVQASLVAASIADSRSHLSRRVALLLARGRNNQAHLLKGRGTLIAFALLCLAALLASTPTLIAFEVPQIPTSVSVPPATTTPPIQAPVPVAPASTRKPRQIAQATPTTAVQPPNNPGIPLYVLGANDVISVKLKDDSDISGTYSIGPDGRVSMPLIGTFSAAGLTIPDLVKLITQKLNAYIVDPVVNVQLLRNNSKKYTLIGGVVRPGPHPLLQETTVLDALAASGGLKELANLKKIVVRRGSREFHFNYKEAIEGKNLEQNIALQDGDMIIVPEQDPPQEKKS